MTEHQIYLAGPDVFYPNPARFFAAKKALCKRHGFEGLAPLDNNIDIDMADLSGSARKIFEANETMMQRSDLCIANLSPFRGVSADAGTVYEVGYMRGIGKPVYGYSCSTADYAARVAAGGWAGTSPDLDSLGQSVEPFKLFDNLMIPFGVEASGGSVILADADPLDLDAHMALFERVLKQIGIRANGKA